MQSMPARPVLKWAGGKRQLLPDILKRLPRSIETYYEPFVGGGAVFFALAAERRFHRAVLADRNPDLVAVYEALQQVPDEVIRLLKRYERQHSEDTYYEVRAQKPRGLAQRAARILYLNKTGYNGLYRVNRSGQFNVPFGRYKNPNICDAENLEAAAQALRGVRIQCADFEPTCMRAKPGDAVYFDPPYLPVSKTSNFAAYDAQPFGVQEHARLARAFQRLREVGVAAVLSKSDTPETRQLFGKFEFDVVPVRRPINSDPSRRGPVSELLVHTR